MTQALQGAQYDTFVAVRSHFHSNGLAMMPTAGIFPQAAQVVALHGGMDYDIIGYFATKRGEPPQIPSPIVTNKNRVFLGGSRVGEIPIMDVSGYENYAVSGYLLFGILAPEGLASSFMLGNVPFPGVDTNEQIPAAYFIEGIINQRMTQTLTTVPTLPPLITGIIEKG